MNISKSQSNLPSPTIYFVYRCTHSYSHPNLGKLLSKGNLYQVSSIDKEHDIIQMTGKSSGCACCTEFFQSHFEEVYTADSTQARKLYVNKVAKELFYKARIIMDNVKCNCANEIIDELAKQLKEQYT